MAQKLTSALGYLVDFTNGQGVGRPAYAAYPADMDTNFVLIQSSVNALCDEVAGANIPNMQLSLDSLLRPIHVANGSVGRMAPWEARITFSGANVTVTSGRIYVGGLRIVVTGATLAHVGGATATNYLAVDQQGLLSISISPGLQHFDLAVLTAAGSVFTAMTENLDFNQNEPLASGYTANRIFEKRRNATLGGGQQPPFRMVSIAGVEEDAGFSYLSPNAFRWQSERDGGPGSGNSVPAGDFTAFGQLALNQQSRIYAIKSGAAANIATGGTHTAVIWDTPVANSTGLRTWRREPSEYFANPFIAASGATLTVPADADVAGTYLITATVTAVPTLASWFEMRIQITSGSAITVAIQRIETNSREVSLSCSGMVDLDASATIQVQCRHGEGGNVPLNTARVGVMMIGGPFVP